MESGGQLTTIGGVVYGGCVNGVQVDGVGTPVPVPVPVPSPLIEATVKGVQSATKVVVVEARRVTVVAVGHCYK